MSKNDKLKVIKRGYSEEAVEILEELLEQAKKGEIHELVTMANYGERHYETRYTNSNDLVTLVGHIEKIKWRMLERMSQNITVL